MLWFPLLLVLIVALARTLGSTRVTPWTANLATMQTVLTIAAISFAIGWYFVERPDAAKLDFTQVVAGYPVVDDRVLVTIEVSVKNVGATALAFDDAPYAIFVQQITPMTQGPWNEHLARAGQLPLVHRADNWSLVAALVSKAYPREGLDAFRPVPGLSSEIEAGETDNYYFRTIVACKPGLRLSVTSRFVKPLNWYESVAALVRPARPKFWIKQTPLDLTTQCRTPEVPK